MGETAKFILHLPKTAFPMKANLPHKEPQLIQQWQNLSIYQKLMDKQKNKKLFCFIDGPPYANGRLHIGHALNKILKDIIVKYANLSGKYCPFIPIWDCHGLPIEMAVLKNHPDKNLAPEKIRQLCRKEALHWVKVQREEFERLGIWADWNNTLCTLDPEYEAQEIRALAKIAEKNLLYRGKKPVHWCPVLQTAIASSEVEYRNKQSPSIYVKFAFPKAYNFLKLKKPKPCFFVIWTTTPWTLPANQAISLKADISYGFFDTGQEIIIIAEALKEDFQKTTNLTLTKIFSCLGKALEKQKASHPFLKQDSLIILGDHVSTHEGTGCVHTAPGHGIEDFTVAMKYQLPVTVPVDERGYFLPSKDEWSGLFVFKANPLIIKKLKNNNKLVMESTILHNYPFNPRANSPLIFRATNQWFIHFKNPKHPVQKKALEEIANHIRFYPDWGKRRLTSMIKQAPDWCISRQRHWGVPIPVFYCKNCHYTLMDSKIMHLIADKMEKSQGIEYWFSHSAQEILPPHTTCPKCQNPKLQKGKDILDVWFDSGICHFVYQKKYPNTCPADIYIEGSDQHRGWFQTSLNSSVAIHNKAPFKTLMTHCFINDAKGYKMSKSKSNVVTLQTLLQQRGADIVRLWVSSEDYAQDFQVSHEILDRITESYRRLRNTLRFMLGNLCDFTPSQAVGFDKMTQVDQWMLGRLSDLIRNVQSHYENFTFHKIYQELNVFFTTKLSSLYLDIIKDRLYTFKKDGLKRKSAQTTLYYLLKNLLSLMSPINTFLCEEAYSYLPGKKEESILLNSFPIAPKEWTDHKRAKMFENWLHIRKLATGYMEKMRSKAQIGSSLETQVIIHAPPVRKKELDTHKTSLKEWLIVSQVHILDGTHLEIEVKKATGSKCLRCWHYTQQLNNQKICLKCIKNL